MSIQDAKNQALLITNNVTEKYAVAILTDIAAAFDNLWWPSLFQRLRLVQLPSDLHNSFSDWRKGRIAEWKEGSHQVVRRITKGCPQGSICGPIFWDIAIEPLLDSLHEDNRVAAVVAYAHGLLVVTSADSRKDLESRGTEVLRKISAWCNRHQFENGRKQKCFFTVEGLNTKKFPTMKPADISIKRATATPYLRLHLDGQQRFNDHTRLATETASNLMHGIARLNTVHYRLPISLQSDYHIALVGSVITFGASVFSPTDRIF